MVDKAIAVIGAGIVGVSTAIWLQRDGYDVTLIDREGPAAGASYGNGGVIVPSGVVPVNSPGLIAKAPGMLMRADSPLFMHWPYLPKMLPWLLRYLSRANVRDARQVALALKPLLESSVEQHRELAAGTGAQRWIEPSDYLFIYDDDLAFKKDSFAWGLRKELGYCWDKWNSDELTKYDPDFGSMNKIAIRFGDHARITNPGAYVNDLVAHFQRQGGDLVIATVEDLDIAHKSVRSISTGEGPIACDCCVIASGAWSSALAHKLGINVAMETERGYHIDLIKPSMKPRAAMMMAAGKFVVTPMQDRIRCAGIVEFGGLQAPAAKAPLALLRNNIRQNWPALEYESSEEWLGHRPAPADSIPFIGRVDPVANLYAAFGHHHVGLTAGAKTGRIIADMIANKSLDVDIKPYRISRFAD